MESQPSRILINKKKSALQSELRTGFALAACIGIGAVGIGILYMIRSIEAPFDISYEGPILLSPAEERAIEIQKQRTMDTDGDGLTDYDELYVHRTSPFLQDTDGDGITDDIEVTLEDETIIANIDSQEARSDEFLDAFGEVFGDSFYVDGGGVDAINNALSGGSVDDLRNVTPELLRQALRAQGATEDQLRYFTDRQLLEEYTMLLEAYEASEAGDGDSFEQEESRIEQEMESESIQMQLQTEE